MTHPVVRFGTAGVIAAAVVVFFLPPPVGYTTQTMHAAALCILVVGFWALGSLPEHIVALLFFLLAMLFAIAPAPVVFSGFASGTLWLVLGGLILAEAVNRTGLGVRLARVLIGRRALSYRALIAVVVLLCSVMCVVMPATVSRILLLVPIMAAVAHRAGLKPGSAGYDGVVLATIMANYQIGTVFLPSNAPNLILAGAAETLYGITFIYGEWLLVQLPVMGVLKAVLLIVLLWMLFPDETRPLEAQQAPEPMTGAERRLSGILITAVALWATDFVHGIHPGWIGLAAGLATLIPPLGVMPMASFTERVKLPPFWYIASILGMGALMVETSLARGLGDALQATLRLEAGRDAVNFGILTVLSTVTGAFVTNVAQPALLAPLASHFADAAGWPLKAALMAIVLGFTTAVFPYQVPPMVVGMQVGGLKLRSVLRITVPVTVLSLTVLMPINYFWWRLIGYFG
ncbi:MAG TPA: SLC13 family permease [Burkholderiales bacterium]|nr:SLC13 family permease [Burkholderiales bacterium]